MCFAEEMLHIVLIWPLLILLTPRDLLTEILLLLLFEIVNHLVLESPAHGAISPLFSQSEIVYHLDHLAHKFSCRV